MNMKNVLLLIVDDVGIDQLSCYDDQNQYTDQAGYPYAYTPNIDRLAASGLRFTQYRSTPVCSPARASILTGKYSFEHAVGYAVKERVEKNGFTEFNMPPGPSSVTLPEAFGGFSFAVGKWHLGVDAAYSGTMDSHPIVSIHFDKWSGTPRNIDVGGPPTTSGYPSSYYNYWWVEDSVRYQIVGKHATEQTADRTIEFIATTSGQWFGYVAFNAPHAPLTLPNDHHGFGSIVPIAHKNTRFRAMLENLDYHIGRILDAVNDDTYVILVSDNGTASQVFDIALGESRYPIGHPLFMPNVQFFHTLPYDNSHFKQTVYEGGVRCPLIIAGPNIVSGVREQLVDVVDLYPTIARILGAHVPRTHAVPINRLLKPLNTNQHLRKFSTCQYFSPNGFMPKDEYEFYNAYYIDGTMKLIHSIASGVQDYRLYDLSVDPLELNPLPASGQQFEHILTGYSGLVY